MHHLTRSQIRSLLHAIPDKRHRCAMLVTYIHGLRISETLALRVRDVADGYIIVPRLKGSCRTEQTLYASSDLEFDEVGMLAEVIKENRLEAPDLLFPYCRSWMNKVMLKAGKKVGLPRHLIHPHVMKHSIAMYLVPKIGIEELKQYLGHKSLNSTGRYIGVSDAAASKAAMAALDRPDVEEEA